MYAQNAGQRKSFIRNRNLTKLLYGGIYICGLVMAGGGALMTAKEYLNQAYRLNELIESNLRELEQLEALATHITSGDTSKDRVQGGSETHDRMGDTMAKIVDLKKEINAEIDMYVDLKKEIRSRIMQIKNNTEKLILKYRYLEFSTWEEIAVVLGFTFQWVHVLHKRALKNFDKILNS